MPIADSMTAEKPVRIAVFDDDEELLFVLRIFFERKGWQVHTFVSSLGALDNVTLCNPDIVLMDNWLPGPGGIAATRAIKASEQTHALPVIIITANAEAKAIATAAGADDYLSKPFAVETLFEKINAQLP